jgi:hypothetical protein
MPAIGRTGFSAWWEAYHFRRAAAGPKWLGHSDEGLLQFERASSQANDDSALRSSSIVRHETGIVGVSCARGLGLEIAW